jgi:hypothetical protein
MVPFIPNEVRQDESSLDSSDQDVLVPTLQDALVPEEDKDVPPIVGHQANLMVFHILKIVTCLRS